MRVQTDELVSALALFYLLLKHHAMHLRSKDSVTWLERLLLWVDLRCWVTSSRECGRHTRKKKRKARALFGPIYFSLRDLLFYESLFLWLLLFSCDLKFFYSLSLGLLFCMRVCVPGQALLRVMFGERKRKTDSHDSYFNLFREYCCTGAVHWVAPACQVCLIMQKEQKNALQTSDFLPKETKLWQTSWTLREQWCKPHFG